MAIDRARRQPCCAHCDLPVPRSRRRSAASGPLFCCFGCRIASELARPVAGGDGVAPGGTLLLRLGLGIFLAINIMVFSWFFYSAEIFGAAAEVPRAYGSLAALFSYLLMFLATAVLVLLGTPLATDALSNLVAPLGDREPGQAVARRIFLGRIDVNLLICIGVVSAYAVSVARTLTGAGSLYYDTAAMILVLVTLGNYLEAGARRKATASSAELLAGMPESAWVERDGTAVEISARMLKIGDRLRVRPGETIAADGCVATGRSHVNEADLTGESRPRPVASGDTLFGGSTNLDGQLWVDVRGVGSDLAVSRMQRMLEAARRERPAIQRTADRLAALFVPGVILLAITVFVWNASSGAATAGLFAALSVLLISCPCALGLAAPLACWNALRRAAARGILIDSAVTLERAARVDLVFFDKTGTLTAAQPGLTRIVTAPGVDESRALGRAATIEASCPHPLARVLIDEARSRGIDPAVSQDVVARPGLGVEARIEGGLFRLGSARFVDECGLHEARSVLEDGADDAATVVYLFDDDRVLAVFHLVEELRSDAAATRDALTRRGIDVAVLTGDRSAAAARLGRLLGLPVQGELLPSDKLERLNESRAAGRAVAMVGDGINDGPVLAAADVGFAVGSATDLARQAGNVHLIGDRLEGVPIALAIARDCMRRIRIGLAWAFGYNALGLTLAALGLLSPIFAASAMVSSSLFVVLVSRRSGCVDRGRPDARTSDVDRDSRRRLLSPNGSRT